MTRLARPTVAHCVNPYLEPTTVWIYDQIRRLARYRPIVITQAVRNRDRFPLEPVYCPGPGVGSLARRFVRKIRGTYGGYPDLVGDDRPQVMHAHFGQEGYRCLDARNAFGVGMVTTFYGMDVSVLPRAAKWRRRYVRLFREGDRFLAEGPHMAETLVRLGAPEDRVRVVRLGVDLDDFPVRTGASDRLPPTILMYAAFREKKGHLFGLRAFARIAAAHPAVRMRLVGDGPLRPQIESEIGHLGLADRVELSGMVSRREGRRALEEATLVLYPSVTAADGDTEGGAPVALLEALATGVPIVASRHADIPFVVAEGCGLLAGEKDVEGLAAALDEMLGSETVRRRCSEAGRRRVVDRHDLSRQVPALEDVYDEIV